jgi:hypothetical protein
MYEEKFDGTITALFIGGLLDGTRMQVSSWQRVHHLRKGMVTQKYVRRHLAFDHGPAIRVFVWERLTGQRGVELLVWAYGGTPGLN